MELTRRELLAALAGAHAVRLQAAEVDRASLAQSALDLAKKAGADYADVRVNRYDYEDYRARERQIQSVSSKTSFGYGVRVLKKGTWGFAATSNVNKDAIAKAAEQAVALHRVL